MTLSNTTKLAMVAVVAWIGIEAVLWSTGLVVVDAIDDSGPDGLQGAIIVLHWVGWVFAQWVRPPALGLMVAEFVTLVQMFVLFWIVIGLQPQSKMPLKESLGLTVLSLFLACLLGLQAGCKTNPSTASELQRLQGTWEGVELGQETPGKSFVRSADRITIRITGNSFHFFRDTNFWFETTIALPAGTDPHQLHATIKDNAPSQGSNAIGKVVVALFKIEDQTLTLATRGGGVEETPISFEEEKVTRYELRKIQPQKKNTQPPKPK